MLNTSDITNSIVIIFKYVLGILFDILLPFVISKYRQYSELKRDLTEILLTVALNTITPTPNPKIISTYRWL
jgi:hypothetical protein